MDSLVINNCAALITIINFHYQLNMNIAVEKAGKKFYRDWIFRDVDISLNANYSLAIFRT